MPVLLCPDVTLGEELGVVGVDTNPPLGRGPSDRPGPYSPTVEPYPRWEGSEDKDKDKG